MLARNKFGMGALDELGVPPATSKECCTSISEEYLIPM